MSENNDDWWPESIGIGFAEGHFLVGKGKTRRMFHVHKTIILAIGSPVFEEIIFRKVHINELADEPEEFELLMNYLYGKVEYNSLVSVWKLYVIGKKYQVPNILDDCMEYKKSIEINEEITDEITEDDFWYGFDNDLYLLPLAHDRMQDFLKENAESLINSEKFLSAPEYFVDELLQMEELNFDEHDLLTAVTEWAYRNFDPPDSEKLLKFYKHIRFGTLTYSDFLRFKECYPQAIDEKNTQDIKEYLHSILVRSLPEWCSTNHICRKNKYLLERRKDS